MKKGMFNKLWILSIILTIMILAGFVPIADAEWDDATYPGSTITSDKVGIGTTSEPTKALEVNGDASFSEGVSIITTNQKSLGIMNTVNTDGLYRFNTIAASITGMLDGATTGSVTGLSARLILSNTEPTAAGLVAADYTAQLGRYGTSGITDVDFIIGAKYTLNRRYDNTRDYNIAESYGFYANLEEGGTAGTAVNVTNHYHNYLRDPGNLTKVRIDNLYGMYLTKMASGINNNYGIVLDGDGEGADIVFGEDQETKLYGKAGDFIIDTSGKVGIGTESPEEILHVAGNIQGDGKINAKYQDLAEWLMTTKDLTPGTVVMIDTEKIDHVIQSDREYNTLVAGVVSATPGILLGEEGKDKAIIAHTGRVKVKVDTSYGEIKTGDLLVTSPAKGYAMKADRSKLEPGMLLGKALQPLAEGQKGKVLALITLQ